MPKIRSIHAKSRSIYFGRRPTGRQTPTELAREVESWIYIVRTRDDLVKIGLTTNLGGRLSAYGGWSTLLVAWPGDLRQERALHRRFVQARARGREYYYPAPGVLAFVDEQRCDRGIQPLQWE